MPLRFRIIPATSAAEPRGRVSRQICYDTAPADRGILQRLMVFVG